MNRATLLCLLLVTTLAVAFQATPTFAVDGPFPGPTLPEQLVPVASHDAPPVLLGRILLVAIAILIVAWRRSVGQGPLLSMIPALVVVFHPTLALAPGSAKGCAELACLAVVVFGAWLMTFGRSAWAIIGAVLGFLAVLAAPSGAALAALFAFALAESEPGLPGAAVWATLYAAARAFELPSLLSYLPFAQPWLDPIAPPEPPFSAIDGEFLCAIEAVAAPLVRFDVSWLAAAPGWSLQGACVVAVLALGALFLHAEKRFGGRAAPLLAAIAIVMLAFEQHHRGLASAAALAPVVLLVALWLATLGDVVDERPMRRTSGALVCAVALAFCAFARVRAEPALASRSTALEVASRPFVASSHLGSIASRTRIESLPRASVLEEAKSRRDGPAPAQPFELERDRDLAIAAALAGDSKLASELLQRAIAQASASASAEERRRIEIDLMDLLLRAGRGDDVAQWCDELLDAERDPTRRSTLLVRKASAHVLRAIARANESVGIRDAEWAAARAALDAAIEDDAANARAWFDRGRLAIVRGDGVAAVRDLERAARCAPSSPHPELQLALFYLSRAQESPALEHFERARAIGGDRDAEVRLFAAQRQLARGDAAGAERIARELEPESARLLGGDAAIADLHANISAAAEAAHDDALALRASMAAFARGGGEDLADAQRLARLLEKTQNYDELVSLLSSLRSRSVPFPDLEDALAIAWKNAGIRCLVSDRKKARDCFLSSVKESVSFRDLGSAPSFLRTMTLEFDLPQDALLEQGKRAFDYAVARLGTDPDGAARALEVSRALVPGNPYAAFHLARIKKQRGATAEARELLEEALRDATAIDAADLVAAVKEELARP